MREYIPAAEDMKDISLLYDKLAENATTLHKCIQGYTCWLESIKDKSLVIHILVSWLTSHILSNFLITPGGDQQKNARPVL